MNYLNKIFSLLAYDLKLFVIKRIIKNLAENQINNILLVLDLLGDLYIMEDSISKAIECWSILADTCEERSVTYSNLAMIIKKLEIINELKALTFS
jgi:hypothetical protein